MLGNQLLYKIITDLNYILQSDCSVWNMKGKCQASTTMETEGVEADVLAFIKKREEKRITDKTACYLIYDAEEPTYVLALHEVPEQEEVTGKLCVSMFENVIHASKKRVDKNRFFQDLILDNMLLVDVYNQAKKLNVDIEAKRAVFVIEPKRETDNLVLETMKGLYTTGTKDYVTSVEEGHIILIKSLQSTDGYKELHHIAKTIVDTVSAEVMVDIRVAYGTIINELKEVSKSYKEASIALDVGRIFYVEKNVLAYNELGIGRLIHQLPYSLCDMFLKEVFQEKKLEQFDEETLTTVNAFFDNDLNISETARKLYIHRNTLGYRLDKIDRTTGLDIKKFDDALTFKIAMMVSKHMKFVQSNE